MTTKESLLATPVEELASSLYSLMISVIHNMPRDMSKTGVATLNTLADSGPLRITRLADLEGVAQPSMTLLVDRLERQGLVERRRDNNDRRATLISLTDAGRSYLSRRKQVGTERLADLIAELPNEQARLLLDALPAISRLRQAAGISGSQTELPMQRGSAS